MKWFTIIMNGPRPELNTSRATLNSAGDFVVFDGWATKTMAVSSCEKIAPHCTRVCLFDGQTVGHLTAEWLEGKKQ